MGMMTLTSAASGRSSTQGFAAPAQTKMLGCVIARAQMIRRLAVAFARYILGRFRERRRRGSERRRSLKPGLRHRAYPCFGCQARDGLQGVDFPRLCPKSCVGWVSQSSWMVMTTVGISPI